MGRDLHAKFSRRERQIMDAVYALGEAGAAEVAAYIREVDAHDTVRVTLGNLEKKGFLRHRVDGQRHIYHPKGSKDDASRSAMRHVVRTFFGGDASRAIVTLLGEARLSREELDEIAAMIDESAEGEA